MVAMYFILQRRIVREMRKLVIIILRQQVLAWRVLGTGLFKICQVKELGR